jgi:hypothetical protein
VAGDGIVDLAHHAGDVAVDVNETGAGRPRRQLHLWKIDRAEGRSDIGIVDQFARNLAADAVPGFFGRPAFSFDRDQKRRPFPDASCPQAGPAAQPGRAAMSTTPKFALKMLLTGLAVRHGSRRSDGVQLAASLLTLAVIVLAGLYIWSHGQY